MKSVATSHTVCSGASGTPGDSGRSEFLVVAELVIAQGSLLADALGRGGLGAFTSILFICSRACRNNSVVLSSRAGVARAGVAGLALVLVWEVDSGVAVAGVAFSSAFRGHRMVDFSNASASLEDTR